MAEDVPSGGDKGREAVDLVRLPEQPRKLSRRERKERRKQAAAMERQVNEQILAGQPELVCELRDAGWDDEKIVGWILKLSPIQATSAELMRLAAPAEDELVAVSPFRRQLTIWRHQLSHFWNHGKGVYRLLYAASWLLLLGQALVKAGLTWWGWASAVIILGVKLKHVIGEMDPKNLPLFQRTLNTRNLLLKTQIERLQHWMERGASPDQLTEFRVDALRLIVSLVRDHRSDLRGKKIFANLLVRSGDGVLVIARADDNRQVPKHYTKEQCSIAWEAFETGVPKMTGDLYAETKTEAGKTYNSVLALPVKLRTDVLAVVSIDSELKHHFHGFLDDLHTHLGPYVQLIASSLIEDHDTKRLPAPKDGE